MGKLGRRLLLIVLVPVVLIIVIVVIAVTHIDSLAKTGIEMGGEKAVGVPTTLRGIHIGILAGTTNLNELSIAEPEGFKAPHFLTLKDGGVAVKLGSLMSDQVEVPTLTLTGIDLYIEKNKDGKPNYQVIMDNQKKLETASAEKPKPEAQAKEEKPGKKFVIRELVIRDVTLHAQLLPIGPAALVKVPEIVLHNVGSDGQGVGMADIVNIVLKATWASAIANGKGILPDDMLKDMSKGLQTLGSLAGSGVQVVGDVTKKAGAVTTASAAEVGKEAAKAGQVTTQAAGQVGKGINDLGKGVGGILGGPKKK